MYKFNKIIVGLDHTATDIDLIQSTSAISQLSGSKEIYFIHVIRDFNLPDKIKKEFPHLIDHAIEERQKELEETVRVHFKHAEPKVTVQVVVNPGQVTKSLLKFSAQHKTDLIVLGRKNEKKNGGTVISRIARRATCSLLVIPKGTTFKLESNILVPTDFSPYAKSALEKAATLARRSGNKPKLIIQHVYQVPVGYHYTGKSFKEFGEIMKEHSQNDYKKFVQQVNLKDLETEDVYTLDKDDDIITDMYKLARKRKSDLIVIGAKGRTATSALFIGSKAERFVQVDSEIALLVVRPKGKKAGLLDYIKEL